MQRGKMSVFSLVVLALIIPCLSQECTNKVDNCDISQDYFPEKITLEHAKTAKIQYSKTYVDIRVTDSQGVQHLHRLVRCGCPTPGGSGNAQVIFVPPARIYVDDSPTLAFLTRSIPQVDRIVAVGNPAYIYSSSIRNRFDASAATSHADLASRTDVDVAFINLDAVAGYKEAVKTVPYFANGESDEATPFGRTEWIKILGLMFQSVESANIEFNDIVSRYNRMKDLANSATRRPSVLLNYPFTWEAATSWSLPSEKQYTTQLLRDANVDYLFMNDGNDATNSLTLEEVTSKFKWARYLIHSGPFPPSESSNMASFFQPSDADNAADVNEALRSLASVQCGNVWVLHKRITSESFDSSNDFFEYGAVRPDLVLQDIVHAVHPNVDVDDATTFSFKKESAAGANCPYNDLLGEAPSGKQYVDFELAISGQNRFDVENKLVSSIIPEVARLESIDSKSIDAFFQKPQESGSTTLLLRTMVDNNKANDVQADSASIVDAVRTGLGGTATVKMVNAGLANGAVIETRNGLGGSAIGGIVGGLLAAALIVGLVLFLFGRRGGKKVGEKETRDRFWTEHGVRLADEA